MKIVMICEHFYPKTGARALQATKVAEALSSIGCEVYVLCGVKSIAREDSPYVVDFVEAEQFSIANNFRERMIRRLRYEFSMINGKSNWVRRMTEKAKEIVDGFEPDVVMTLSTPFNVHLIGLNLPECVRRKWVAYFSDLWPLALAPHPYRTPVSKAMSFLQIRSLRNVLSCAGKVIFSNDVSVVRAQKIVGSAAKGKYFSVGHVGTQCADGLELSGDLLRFKGRFVHVGKLTKERSCEGLVEAIIDLVSGGAKAPAFPGFSFVGEVDPKFRQMCADLERSGIVEFVSEVDPSVAQAVCRAAGVLVVIEAKMCESPFLPSKFCDYAMLQKPILAISPSGPIREYLSRYGGGVAVAHDRESICSGIRSLMVRDDGKLQGSQRLAEQFDATRVARKYLGIFESRV
jgi:glycosyltransferase involved in cell wall biosynthesis